MAAPSTLWNHNGQSQPRLPRHQLHTMHITILAADGRIIETTLPRGTTITSTQLGILVRNAVEGVGCGLVVE